MTATRRSVDMVLLASVVLLLAVGIGMVFSASFVIAHRYFGDGAYFITRHGLCVLAGLVAMAFVARTDYRIWQRIATPFYAVSLLLLVAVLVPGIGTSNYGASRWLSLGPLPSFQPSEVAKVALIVYLASWITRLDRNVNRLTFGTIPFAVILSLSAGLVLVEPDLGTAAILVLTAASVFFIAGANVFHALLGAALGIFLLVNVVVNSGYRADRIEAFKDPWSDPAGVGWHTTQALTALGSGGFSGLGLGAGRKKFEYLPNAHTDSIYAVVGEETGFVGASVVLGLFLLFTWRGLFITVAVQDSLGRALAAGATCLIGWQAFMNMAVISHVVPNTGVPLPFLSYGGTAMIVNLTAVGILLSVSRSIEPGSLSWLAVLRNWRTLVGSRRTERLQRRADDARQLVQPAGR